MFDIGADELLLTAVVAIVVIGPKDMPRALRTMGRWVARMRRMSGAFRAGIENVIREAELEEMEAEWRKQNAAIMAAHPMEAIEADAKAAEAAAGGDPATLPPPAEPQIPVPAEPQMPFPVEPPAPPRIEPQAPDPAEPFAQTRPPRPSARVGAPPPVAGPTDDAGERQG
ncbi:MAG TPA: Sec-independent protein translocase protein TatB [Novosphingobium sp.]|nr:Sec-independent protein translocase protein TatB [Novosphingobium sp.]